MTINLQGILQQPGQGFSYWVLGDSSRLWRFIASSLFILRNTEEESLTR